jgi:hypothetical protein
MQRSMRRPGALADGGADSTLHGRRDLDFQGRPYSVTNRAGLSLMSPWLPTNLITLVLQVNGKVRGRITMPVGLTEAGAWYRLENEAVQRHLTARLRKLIYVQESGQCRCLNPGEVRMSSVTASISPTGVLQLRFRTSNSTFVDFVHTFCLSFAGFFCC